MKLLSPEAQPDVRAELRQNTGQARSTLRSGVLTYLSTTKANPTLEVPVIRKFLSPLAIALAFASPAFAAGTLSVDEITSEIIKSSTAYANSISCPHVKIAPQQIAALVPWKEPDDRWDATYAVLWDGDIDCSGGSGGERTNISIVAIRAGNSFVVDPRRSSPAVQFDTPVRYVTRLVGNTENSLVLEGLAYGPNDGNCCPSVPTRFTVQADAKGNWRLTKKKTVQTDKVQRFDH